MQKDKTIKSLPKEVLPSQAKELPRHEKAAFTFGLIEVDEDIMAALEASDEEGFEELDDDFVKMANGIEEGGDVLEMDEDENGEEWSDISGDSEGEEQRKKPERKPYVPSGPMSEHREILEEKFERVIE